MLKTPDEVRLSAVQSLCEIRDPYPAAPVAGGEGLFLEAMAQVIDWHAELNPFYRRLLSLHRFSAKELLKHGDLTRIPFIPANFFKRNEVVSVPREAVSLHLTSSGTTGQKSQMFFDAWSIGCAQRMVDWIFEYYGWVTPARKANYLLYSYETHADSKLGTAYTDNFLCKYAPAGRVFSALRRDGQGGHDFDVFGCIRLLQEYEREGLPVRIFGFPAFLHFTLERMKALGFGPLKLSPESLVFLGGGWKGNAGKAVSKEELYRMAHEMLGIPDEMLRDGFGSVEHCVPYVECSKHRFHVPVWSRVLIRDLKTLEPLPYGHRGFLQFVSPYITSVPAQSVLMGDLASLHPAQSCECGLPADWFEIHGRAGTSRNKSCAIAAAELLGKSGGGA